MTDYKLDFHVEWFGEVLGTQFMERYSHIPRLVTLTEDFAVSVAMLTVAEELAAMFPKCVMRSSPTGDRNTFLVSEDLADPDPVLISIANREGQAPSWDDDGGEIANPGKEAILTANVLAGPGAAVRVMTYLNTKYSVSKTPTVKWHFWSPNGAQTMSIKLGESTVLHDEFYPWLPGGCKKFFENYLASSSCLLFLAGEAGTGKTSLLRSMLWEHSMKASVAYDHRLLETDDIFIKFLTGSDQVLILEDAEEFLKSRSLENHMMARFLNVSDGLVRPKNKKIVFTTNFKEFKDIDEAMLRPGRCFDFVEFRALSYEEAKIAAVAAGLPEPPEQRNYTLAELFNQTQKTRVHPRVGFSVSHQ